MKKVIFLMALIGGMGMSAQQQNAPNISVTGEATVNVVPDEVTINANIEHEGENAEKVKTENDEVINKVIKFLRKKGIKENDVQTNYVNLSKRFVNYEDKENSPQIYTARQSISIKLHNIDTYEEIMQGLLENGLNGISGVEFSTSKKEQYEAEARKKAVMDAKKKAQDYAQPLGAEVGNPLFINENQSNNPVMYRAMDVMAKSSSGRGKMQTLAPGEMEITSSVTISFRLQ